jgi:hypothetical protein
VQSIVFKTFHKALTDNTRLEPSEIYDADDEAKNPISPEELLDELQRTGYVKEEDTDGRESFALDAQAFPALCSLYFEGRVRHELSTQYADDFMWLLLDDIYPGRKTS